MGRSGSSQTDAARGALSPDELRTERSIALIRMAVITVVAAVYLGAIGVRRASPLAIAILALAALYGLWSLLDRPYEAIPPNRFAAATLLADAGLITVWCLATGGPDSEYGTLYLIAVVAIAMRYDLLETFFSALGLTLLYMAVMSIDGGLSRAQLLSRVPFMLITGFAVGILARQRRTNQEERELLARIAEDRSRALVEEQAVSARLRELDLAKSEFVAVASHEFRTPLAAVLGVLATLRARGDNIDPSIRDELLEGAAAQAERLARLVDDLLTISRIEDGALRLDVQPVHAERLISDAVRASATEGVIVVDARGVGRVDCDADSIVRVLTNLLDNARKYSPPDGRIFVTVTRDAEAVAFSVRDQGPGIPEERRDEVFERFRRLSQKPDKPGSGLGLYIARCLIEAHGGTIRVGQGPSGGAEFVFTLPNPPGSGAVGAAERPTAATPV